MFMNGGDGHDAAVSNPVGLGKNTCNGMVRTGYSRFKTVALHSSFADKHRFPVCQAWVVVEILLRLKASTL